MGAKINYSKYLLLSAIVFVIEAMFAHSKTELVVMAVTMVAAALNQWMLLKVVKEVSENAASGAEIDKADILIMTISKFLVLIVALSFGVHIMGSRVIILVLTYVLQIAILYLSFEKQKGIEKD